MKAFGTRPTYQIFSGMTLITGLVYFMFNTFYLRKRPQVEGNDIVKKKPKKIETKESGEKVEINMADKEIAIVNDKISYGSDNKAFSKDQDDNEKSDTGAKEIEAIKNARNLDKIEKIEDVVNDETTTNDTEQRDDSGVKSNHNLKNGNTNTAYETEDNDGEGKCNVTIEKQPDDNK